MRLLVAHNASFDVSFISHNASRGWALPFRPTVLDTVALARVLLPNLNRYKLDTVAKAAEHLAGEPSPGRGRRGGYGRRFSWPLCRMLKDGHGVKTLDDLNVFNKVSDETIMKLPTYHVIILATNDLGRVNLYRLVSWSHIRTTFPRRPRIPKSLLNEYREGLIIGSACEAGELYQALLRGVPETPSLPGSCGFMTIWKSSRLGTTCSCSRMKRVTVKTVADLDRHQQKDCGSWRAVRKAGVRHLRRAFSGSRG